MHVLTTLPDAFSWGLGGRGEDFSMILARTAPSSLQRFLIQADKLSPSATADAIHASNSPLSIRILSVESRMWVHYHVVGTCQAEMWVQRRNVCPQDRIQA